MNVEEQTLLGFLRLRLLPTISSLEELRDLQRVGAALGRFPTRRSGREELTDLLLSLWEAISPVLSAAVDSLPAIEAIDFPRRLALQLLVLSFLGSRHPALRWADLRSRLLPETEQIAQAETIFLLTVSFRAEPSLSARESVVSALSLESRYSLASLAPPAPSAAPPAENQSPQLLEQLRAAEALVGHYRAEAEKHLLGLHGDELLAKQLAFAQQRAQALERQLELYQRELTECLRKMKEQEQRLGEARSDVEQARHQSCLLQGEVDCLRTTAQRYNSIFATGAEAGPAMYAGEDLERELRGLCRALAMELRACYAWAGELGGRSG